MKKMIDIKFRSAVRCNKTQNVGTRLFFSAKPPSHLQLHPESYDFKRRQLSLDYLPSFEFPQRFFH